MVQNRHAEKSLFLGLCHSLLMDLGQDQQYHPNVHCWGVCRVPFGSPTAHLPLPFGSPSAHLPLPFRSPFAPLENSTQKPFSTLFHCFQTFLDIFKHFHPNVNRGGVSRVPFGSPSAPLRLPFGSPSAHLPLAFFSPRKLDSVTVFNSFPLLSDIFRRLDV